jgi:hypothetical protein
MRVLIAILLSIVSLLAQSSQPASDDQKKTVHVRQYTRKDGTVVRRYDRAAPGTAGKAKTPTTSKRSPAKARSSNRAK